MFLGATLIVSGWEVVSWDRKFYLGTAEIASFSRRDLRTRNKHDSFWLFLSTGYFYILFSWVIVVADFLPLEIHKHLVLPLSSITFKVNSQAYNRFYKHIYLFQILHNFLLKYTLSFFKFKWFNCEIPPLFFLIKIMVYRKNSL